MNILYLVHAGTGYSQVAKRSSNIMAKGSRAGNPGTFRPPLSKLRIAVYISFVAALSVGSDPRILIGLRTIRFRPSIALVV